MIDSADILGALANDLRQTRSAFETGQQTRDRAAVTERKLPIEEKIAYTRLAKVLDSGEPLRGDVPPGYYFNVSV